MDGMLDDGGGEQSIKQFDQGVTTTSQGGINLLTKGAQPLKCIRFHAMSMPKRAFLVYLPSPPPCCWLNSKLISYRSQCHVVGVTLPIITTCHAATTTGAGEATRTSSDGIGACIAVGDIVSCRTNLAYRTCVLQVQLITICCSECRWASRWCAKTTLPIWRRMAPKHGKSSRVWACSEV